MKAILRVGVFASMCALLFLPRMARAQTPLTITQEPPGCATARRAVGIYFECELIASGGTPPYKWAAIANLPPGITAAPTGENKSVLFISGVPEEPNDGSPLLPLPPGKVTVETAGVVGESLVGIVLFVALALGGRYVCILRSERLRTRRLRAELRERLDLIRAAHSAEAADRRKT